MKKGVKKVLSVALAAGMVVPMVACGSSGGSKGSSSSKSSSSGKSGKVLNIMLTRTIWTRFFPRMRMPRQMIRWISS